MLPASYHLGIGSFAYNIPAFDLCGTGIDHGRHIERYELAGAVVGIEAAASIDASTRPIHVHTDSDFVLAVLKRLAEKTELPPRRSYNRVRDLIQRASTALGPRILSIHKMQRRFGGSSALPPGCFEQNQIPCPERRLAEKGPRTEAGRAEAFATLKTTDTT